MFDIVTTYWHEYILNLGTIERNEGIRACGFAGSVGIVFHLEFIFFKSSWREISITMIHTSEQLKELLEMSFRNGFVMAKLNSGRMKSQWKTTKYVNYLKRFPGYSQYLVVRHFYTLFIFTITNVVISHIMKINILEKKKTLSFQLILDSTEMCLFP